MLQLKKNTFKIPSQIQLDLQLIEHRLKETAVSNNPTMHKIISSAVLNGGKRLRPLLIMAMFRALNGKNEEEALKAATALELIHTASLVHDDIMDESKQRRGAITAYAEFGLSPALLAGDYLFVEGYGIASLLPNKVVNSVVVSLKRLGEGQMAEELANNTEYDFDTYNTIVRDKTAYLFWGSCRIGSILADADNETIEAMSEAGLSLGIAFQFIDDILDIIGDTNLTGKPIGTDFVMGKMTLPYFIYQEEFGALPKVRSEESFRQILNDLSSDRVLDKAKNMALTYTEKTISIFDKLPESEIKSFLIELCEEMQNRIK